VRLIEGGQVSYRLKKPWADGRTHLVLSPVAFLRRLAGILPPPGRHLVRYAGVFAPRAKLRGGVVALAPAHFAQAAVLAAASAVESTSPAAPPPRAPRRRDRLSWAELLQPVFAQDVLACLCGERRRVLAFITDTEVAKDIVTALGLPATIPTVAPARAPPWPSFQDCQSPAEDDTTGDHDDDTGDPAPDDFADPPASDEFDPA
jgi:hypothetical protein